MEERIEKAYEARPKTWVYNCTILAIVVILMIWSATSMETSGTTTDGGKIALNILSGIFHPDTKLLLISRSRVYRIFFSRRSVSRSSAQWSAPSSVSRLHSLQRRILYRSQSPLWDGSSSWQSVRFRL